MGRSIKRALTIAPLAAVLTIAGLAGTADAATAAPALFSGECTIYINGAEYWNFVSTQFTCQFEAADLQASAPSYFITYTWFPRA